MYLIHRNDLAVTSTSGTTLDTERRALTRLTHASERRPSKMCAKSLRKTDGSSRLALTKRRRRDTASNYLGMTRHI